jgi:hypothetical protein
MLELILCQKKKGSGNLGDDSSVPRLDRCPLGRAQENNILNIATDTIVTQFAVGNISRPALWIESICCFELFTKEI